MRSRAISASSACSQSEYRTGFQNLARVLWANFWISDEDPAGALDCSFDCELDYGCLVDRERRLDRRSQPAYEWNFGMIFDGDGKRVIKSNGPQRGSPKALLVRHQRPGAGGDGPERQPDFGLRLFRRNQNRSPRRVVRARVLNHCYISAGSSHQRSASC